MRVGGEDGMGRGWGLGCEGGRGEVGDEGGGVRMGEGR